MGTPTKEEVIRQAEKAHQQHPQYRGHWRGPRDVAEMVDLQKFVAVRYRLERLAVQIGARQLKSAACLLVLDDGDGQEARRALAELRSCPFEHGEVKSIIHEIEQLLEAA